jgi:outer membrane lipoprotein carrier protein
MRFTLKMIKTTGLLLAFLFIWSPTVAFSDNNLLKAPVSSGTALSLEEVIANMEARYGQQGFACTFFQTSTLKALEITDSATGRIFIKRPGRMRWEYDTPDKQIIVSNGETLWIHRPDDNQVMIGKAHTFFSGSRGAAFLSDITQIRSHFNIVLTTRGETLEYLLTLVPKKPTDEVKTVSLAVSKKTFDVVRVTTYNAYEDETQLIFNDLQFHDDLDDALFNFSPPEGAEILEIGE